MILNITPRFYCIQNKIKKKHRLRSLGPFPFYPLPVRHAQLYIWAPHAQLQHSVLCSLFIVYYILLVYVLKDYATDVIFPILLHSGKWLFSTH